jgi:acyl-CoA reductase-like NAD-dependent aldehyde dehydrogenase
VLPVIIFAVVAIPLLVIGFLVVSRNRRTGEHPATETDADRERTEREFAEAEAYQEKWREQTHGEVEEERFP